MAQLFADIPDDLHRRAKAQAALEGIALRQLVMEALEARLRAEPPLPTRENS